jgi:type IX secretion system PorP/SprF family membrane protein
MPEMSELSLTYRNQWPGIPANFVTYAASFVQPVSDINSGTGVVFFNDNEAGGVYSRTSASILYGYSFQASHGLTIYSGLQASYVIRQFNPENLVFATDILNALGESYPPPGISDYKRGYPDFSLGFMGKHKKGLLLGVSASHVTRPKESFSVDNYDRLPVKYSFFTSFKLSTGSKYNRQAIALLPSLWYIHQGNTNELVWGSELKYNFLSVGAWLRQNFNLNFSALILTAGISQKKYTFFYSYDVNLTRVNFLSTKMGSHEVTFLFRFEYKRNKFGAVKCPE